MTTPTLESLLQASLAPAPEAAVVEYIPGRAEKWSPQRLNYTHDALIDAIIAQPQLHQYQLAEMFGRSARWVHLVCASDAFQARLAERKKEMVDPTLSATIDERLGAVAAAALDKVLDKLADPKTTPSEDFLLQAAKMATTAMGYGAKPMGGASAQVAVVVQVPSKAASPEEWVAAHAPRLES